ncbi:MAG: phosphoribosylamine--glycine ligase [Candidatus Wildermuthbacteria bacterium RIFCSPHIGHO2_01_FULL_49_22b]|uniref:Phosphoribosylamine--glycine ligase n=1 Tax=Candidatus Wildermuthbacteria bacterium RIFCSPHIGHO2_01_FULL_49_22b TaxID=1802448 RepID=A0A1G2QXL6_9BACT|nr:MAG: phosphoribosylamine--glycine ligase [Candidatus Wildermuthbacteria bacterium RIFCSPHIGHO2_01_FULL_49_22b]
MRVLVLGNGAREHALAWRISQSPECKNLFVWPGNGGTEQCGWNVHLNAEQLIDHVAGLCPDYVVIGPETFLADGLVDKLAEKGIPAFGPTRAAAKVETSKEAALQLMQEAKVPHPKSWTFPNPHVVATFVQGYNKPVAVKPDGLTGGKGVQLCSNPKEAENAANLCGELYPDQPIVVQELLQGREVSVFCFTDGYHVSPLVVACDYKRLLDGDQGPNTGGMGSYSWPRFWNKPLEEEILQWIVMPILGKMELKGTPFVGMLYAGLMLTKEGPKVLEFNARFGDPEAQVILPLLQGDLLDIMLACTQGRLDKVQVSWNHALHAVGVVMAFQGYPGKCEGGHPVTRRYTRKQASALVFHGSTRLEDKSLVTDGASGRVLTVVGTGTPVSHAREMAYYETDKWGFFGATWREDIAAGN